LSIPSIGVFDSGIGGLTVVKELFASIPHARIVYFGDTARLPYGTKSVATVRRYAEEDTELLLQHNVGLIVVACNTVSAVALDVVERLAGTVPVIGMIEPAAHEAVQVTQSGKIGIIGTQATIASGAYESAIASAAAAAGKTVSTYAQACPLFVPLAEEGWQDHEVARLAAKTYLMSLVEAGIDTLILGCTHYPVLADVIQETVGAKVHLINSGAVAARQVHAAHLAQTVNDADHLFMVSDLPSRFRTLGERFLGRSLPTMHEVVFKEAWILRRSA
jgi:glutamate racemase